MSTVAEIEAAIRALTPKDREKLADDLPSILPELNGDAKWQRIISDPRPRPALTALGDQIEAQFKTNPAPQKNRPQELPVESAMKKPIHASEVYFIKLGSKGGWEDECLRKRVVKVGFREANHHACKKGQWNRVFSKSFRRRFPPGTVTDFTRQIKAFYESGPGVLWITFFGNNLWWCFAKKPVTRLAVGDKIKRVIGDWRDTDINGARLSFDRLSGKLLKVRGYRSTICSVEPALALRAINADVSHEVEKTRETVQRLKQTIAAMVTNLHWKDFELLVDLIFTRAGWQRIRELGKTEKTLDLEVSSPVLGERGMVQVKSQSSKREFEKYWREFNRSKSFARCFYVVHTPDKSLERVPKHKKLRLLLADDIAELAINAGLTEWILKKCP